VTGVAREFGDLSEWVRCVGTKRVELRRVKKHAFFDEDENVAGGRRLILQFEREDGACS
jgi:hypothetical protein